MDGIDDVFEGVSVGDGPVADVGADVALEPLEQACAANTTRGIARRTRKMGRGFFTFIDKIEPFTHSGFWWRAESCQNSSLRSRREIITTNTVPMIASSMTAANNVRMSSVL